MKKFAAALLGLFSLVSPAVAGPAIPPAFPWFLSAVRQFLDEPRVLVLGWSKDGKAALLYPEDGGGRGGPGLNLLLVDTVEDKVLDEESIWPDEVGLGDADSQQMAQNIWYGDKAQNFMDALATAAIEPFERPGEISAFPLKTSKNQYSAGAMTLPLGENEEGIPGRPLEWRLIVQSEQGQKTIAQGKEKRAISVEVRGYAASPWEQRILVVYGITHPGFEGEQPLSYAFSGCLLTKGFVPK